MNGQQVHTCNIHHYHAYVPSDQQRQGVGSGRALTMRRHPRPRALHAAVLATAYDADEYTACSSCSTKSVSTHSVCSTQRWQNKQQ
jgi:hypothetical protein